MSHADRILEIEEQAVQLGGLLRLAPEEDNVFEITQLRLPRWAGDRNALIEAISDLGDQQQLAISIKPMVAIRAGERKIAVSLLIQAEFDLQPAADGDAQELLLRLPNPVLAYTPDPV